MSRLLLIEEGVELSYDREREFVKKNLWSFCFEQAEEYLWLSYAADGEGKAPLDLNWKVVKAVKAECAKDIVYPQKMRKIDFDAKKYI